MSFSQEGSIDQVASTCGELGAVDRGVLFNYNCSIRVWNEGLRTVSTEIDR